MRDGVGEVVKQRWQINPLCCGLRQANWWGRPHKEHLTASIYLKS